MKKKYGLKESVQRGITKKKNVDDSGEAVWGSVALSKKRPLTDCNESVRECSFFLGRAMCVCIRDFPFFIVRNKMAAAPFLTVYIVFQSQFVAKP